MKVNFILPFIYRSGGVAVVLEYAARLRGRGHDVRVYYPLFPYSILHFPKRPNLVRYCLSLARTALRAWRRHTGRVAWFREPAPVRAAPWIHARFIRDADASVATTWPTAADVAAFPASKGKKFYFIQDYEIWGFDPAEVEATYRLPLRKIVIAPWLTRLIEAKSGAKPYAEIHNGIEVDFFRPPRERDWSQPCVLMMYHTLASKGSEDGLEALRRLVAARPQVRVRAFGLAELPARWDFVEYHRDPDRETLLRLYQSATVFLSPSRSEGWGLPVTEAMACGCAVVATDVGCVPVLKSDGAIAAVPPGDREAVFARILSWVDDPGACQAAGAKALQTASRLGWEVPTDRFEAALISSQQEAG